jgi:hypothetical protein
VSFDSILTLVSAISEAVIISLLLQRKTWRILPVFSSYLAWTLISDAAALYWQTHGVPDNYFSFYAVDSTVDSILMFVVLVELGWSVLRPVRSSLPRGAIFVVAGLVAVAGAIIWPFAGISIPAHLTPQAATFIHLNQTSVILRVVCFLVMAGFSQLLSIGWHDRELQVATGLGLYSMVSLLVTFLDAHQTNVLRIHNFHQAVSISYLCTLAYWVLSFSAKEYQRKEFSPQMQQLLVLMGGGARSGSIALTDLTSERLRKKD